MTRQAFIPVFDKIFVEADDTTQTPSGLHLPVKSDNPRKFGTVVAVGEGQLLPDGTFLKPRVKEGDRILYLFAPDKGVAMTVEIDNKEYHVITNDLLVAKIFEGEK